MIELKAVSKIFKSGESDFFALNDISIKIPKNRITIISGPSGSGKSTLLSIIGLLQTPSDGDVWINNGKIDFKNTSYLRNYINQNISYVFQEFNLIDDFSVIDNLLMVCDNLKIVNDILSVIGLLTKKQTPTKLLSGGEKQRLAIGRAIAKSGDIILLDEPTGNLDEENSQMIFDLLKQFSSHKTIIVVTHNMKLASNYADFVILLKSGRVASQFSLTQNSYTIDFVHNNIDAFLPMLDIFHYKISNVKTKMLIIDGESEKTYYISSSTLLSFFSKIYDEYKGKVIKMHIESNDIIKTNVDPLGFINPSAHIFPFRFIGKYSLILFKSKMWRNIFSIFLLILNMIMIFVYTNFVAYDYIGATKNAVNENDAYFSQPYILETNDITSEIHRYFSGTNLYESLDDIGVSPLPMLRVNSNLLNLQLSLVIIDQPVYFKNTLIKLPSIDEVIISNFISSIAQNDTIAISNAFDNDFEFNYSLSIEEVVDCDFNQQDLQKFLNDPNYQSVNKDRFVNDYGIAFISSETFLNIKQSAQLRFFASNFFLSNQSMRLYAENKLSYGAFSNNNLIAGRLPTDEYDIVISSSLFEQYKFFLGFDSMSECLEQEVIYKDLNDSPNRDLYQTILNLYDITTNVRIVGITDDTGIQVYVSDSFMRSILLQKDFYLSGYFVDFVSISDSLKEIINTGIYFDLSYLEPILTMKNLIHSTFIFLILGAMLVVLTSTITFLCLTFISNVKGKYKEIAILKSFGTRKRKITGLFLLLNYFIAIVSIIGGLILAFVSLNFINMAFMSPNVFSINYSLLNTTPISLIIVILVPLLAALISTFLSLRKVNKIDIALALKMY